MKYEHINDLFAWLNILGTEPNQPKRTGLAGMNMLSFWHENFAILAKNEKRL
jgi:hypothetical protein